LLAGTYRLWPGIVCFGDYILNLGRKPPQPDYDYDYTRWGRSLPDLVVTLKELAELRIGFVSLTEAFDMTTPTGRALAGMLAVFAEFEHEILRERVKAGIAQARAKGTTFGRPKSAAKKTAEIRRLYRKEKLSKSEIARRLGIGRTSVRRLLENS
jgi:DNA invertase Pin-like site-specific DNA recombinase